MPDFSASLARLAQYFLPLLLGLTCHEVAHGWIASRLGDPTARNLGRLTFNPGKHLDPLGSFVFIMTSLLGGFVIGWAKPVPVDPRYFKNPRNGMMWVSLAGPGANLVLAVLFSLLLRLIVFVFQGQEGGYIDTIVYPLALIAKAGVDVNIMLAIFNLLPMPPLDGSKVVANLLPFQAAYKYLSFGERYGFFLILLLLATGLLTYVIVPPFLLIRSLLL